MRGFHHAGFLPLFRQVEHATAPGPGIDQWRSAGVEWKRERHGFWGRSCSFQIETHELIHAGAASTGWSLLFVIETWWGRSRETALRSTHWGRVETGRSAEIQHWFQARAARQPPDTQ